MKVHELSSTKLSKSVTTVKLLMLFKSSIIELFLCGSEQEIKIKREIIKYFIAQI